MKLTFNALRAPRRLGALLLALALALCALPAAFVAAAPGDAGEYYVDASQLAEGEFLGTGPETYTPGEAPDATQFPAYPNAGGVSVGKTATWLSEEGVAQITLQLKGQSLETRGVDVVLVLDTSASMVESTRRLDKLKDALTGSGQFIHDFFAGDPANPSYVNPNRIGAVWFNYKSGVLSDFVGASGEAALTAAVDGLAPGDGTNYIAAMDAATKLIEGRTGADAAREAYVVFMSDGAHDYPVTSTPAQIDASLAALRAVSAGIFTIGFDVSLPVPVARLQNMATAPGVYIAANSGAVGGTIADAFSGIAGVLRLAATDAVVTDQIDTRYFELYDTGAAYQPATTPAGGEVTTNAARDTITWVPGDAGSITDQEATLTYYVKMKPGLAPGTAYPTNRFAYVTYKNALGKWAKKYFPVSKLGNPGGSIKIVYMRVNAAGNPVTEAGDEIPELLPALNDAVLDSFYAGYADQAAMDKTNLVRTDQEHSLLALPDTYDVKKAVFAPDTVTIGGQEYELVNVKVGALLSGTGPVGASEAVSLDYGPTSAVTVYYGYRKVESPAEPPPGSTRWITLIATAAHAATYYEESLPADIYAEFPLTGKDCIDVGTMEFRFSLKDGVLEELTAGDLSVGPELAAMGASLREFHKLDSSPMGEGYTAYAVYLTAQTPGSFTLADGKTLVLVKAKLVEKKTQAVSITVSRFNAVYYDAAYLDGEVGIDADAWIQTAVATQAITVKSKYDVNGDDKITLADVNQVRQYLGAASPSWAAAAAVCDLDGDGAVGLADLTLMMAKYEAVVSANQAASP
jgi:Mg-chelatase subunit ChlD